MRKSKHKCSGKYCEGCWGHDDEVKLKTVTITVLQCKDCIRTFKKLNKHYPKTYQKLEVKDE